MFANLAHAEAAFRAAVSRLSDGENGDDLASLSDAFDYVLNECIRRGRARLVWHQEPPTSGDERR